MLTIGIHQDHNVTARGLQTSRQSGLFAKITRQLQDHDFGVSLAQTAGNFKRVITTAIINDDNFYCREEPLQSLQYVRDYIGKVAGFIESGQHARNRGRSLLSRSHR